MSTTVSLIQPTNNDSTASNHNHIAPQSQHNTDNSSAQSITNSLNNQANSASDNNNAAPVSVVTMSPSTLHNSSVHSNSDVPSSRSGSPLITSTKSRSNSSLKTAAMRLTSDARALEDGECEGISASPLSENNLFVWRAMIMGPVDGPFEGGAFSLSLHFPPEYPNKPPHVKFISKMFHPVSWQNNTRRQQDNTTETNTE